MTTRAERMARAVALVGAAVGLAVSLAAGAVGAPAARPEAAQPPAGKGPALELVGASVCQNCHGKEFPEKENEYKQTLGFEFVRLWENLVWEKHDLHSQAYKNLATEATKRDLEAEVNPTAATMEANLRRTARGDKYTVATDVWCLACHASAKFPPSYDLMATWTAADHFNTDTKDGVGCEMCHGHGSAYRDPHQLSKLDKKTAPPGAIRSVAWREWDPVEKKSKEFGLVNLRDPAVATTQCASCHVGNRAEGRFVTHEMYAAGHPPLPPMDLVAYSREQPRHWGLPSQMPYLIDLATRDAEKAWKVFHIRAGESAVARRFAESAVATLEANLELAGQLAEAADGGLDYAAFDCYACHHDLKYPSDRQARGYLGPPGRPLFRPAPFALARVVADHAATLKDGGALSGRGDKLFEVEKQLAKAFGAKTLGDPALIKAAVAEGKKQTRDTLGVLQKVTYDPAARDGLLAAVVAAAGREPNPKEATAGRVAVSDPESAQLYAWAYETLARDAAGVPGPKVLLEPPPKSVIDLRTRLAGKVVTQLRPNANFDGEVTPTTEVPAPSMLSVSNRIRTRMQTFNAFEAKPFREAIAPPKK